MRIVIDLQALQSPANATRGIGRYARSLVQNLLRAAPQDEFILLMNGMIGERNDWLARAVMQGLPNVTQRLWYGVAKDGVLTAAERQTAQAIRAAVIADCAPDVVLLTSLFEGKSDNTVVSITDHPTAVVHYDLIPQIFPDIYLSDPAARTWFDGKIADLLRADLLLTMSDNAAQDLRSHLGVPDRRILGIGADADPVFAPQTVDDQGLSHLARSFGLTRPFLMFTGGIDPRKNISGLIAAFAALPKPVRSAHQLAIVCTATDAQKTQILEQAKAEGLDEDAVILTGHVSEADLVTLYSACTAFVFPSWYEGFGLPLLEAMRCGAPVIGSSTSAMPEVIGRADALFDPHSTGDMARLIEKVLTDDAFRQSLRDWALVHATGFNWSDSAQRALAGLRDLVAGKTRPRTMPPTRKPRLAFVSPLPPERSGISFYSADLLPALAEHYDIDLILHQKTVANDIARLGLPMRNVDWLRDHQQDYDRVIYQFGNSDFHAHMFDLVEEIPGVVVLHDFFLSNIEARLDPSGFNRQLGETYGYCALIERHDGNQGLMKALISWPVNARALRSAVGVIVHSDHCLDLARNYYDAATVADWAVVPMVRTLSLPSLQERAKARANLNLAEDEILICSFGYVSAPKLPHRIISALLQSDTATNPKVRLVFVGEAGDLAKRLLAQVSGTALARRVSVTDWVSPEVYERYLRAADIAIQLRAESRGESSDAVLDCQNQGLPVIVNAHGSLADLPVSGVLRIADEFDDSDLASAIDRLIADPALRSSLGRAARLEIQKTHAPAACALAYCKAIESFHERRGTSSRHLMTQIAKLPADPSLDADLAQAMADSLPAGPRMRQLFVDVGALINADSNTGIQRVVRAIIDQWLRNPPPGWRVEPVFADMVIGRFRYARRFTCGFLGFACDWSADAPIDYRAGDHFLGLDLLMDVVPKIDAPLAQMAAAGVKVSFVVYDMLPILRPQHFYEMARHWFPIWLETISCYDNLICISQSVAAELRSFLAENPPAGPLPHIDWFHLGADLETATTKVPHLREPASSQTFRVQGTTFLMVGTVEPRKGHSFALDAFEHFWAEGGKAVLVIAGKQGWMVEALSKRLRQHPEYGKRLIWLESVTDAHLHELYTTCTGLIAASEGEGFGLPLIEASRHDLPILARDIPVFRELAGGYATFFDGADPQNLKAVLHDWIVAHAAGTIPRSGKMPFLTWQQSAAMLLERLAIRSA